MKRTSPPSDGQMKLNFSAKSRESSVRNEQPTRTVVSIVSQLRDRQKQEKLSLLEKVLEHARSLPW